MEEEKKQISKKTLVAIIIALIVVVVTVVGITIFLISNNNSNKRQTSTRQEDLQEQENEQNENLDTLSDNKLKEYTEIISKCKFGNYEPIKISKIEKYEEYQKDIYIYLCYYTESNEQWVDICMINTIDSITNPKVYKVGCKLYLLKSSIDTMKSMYEGENIEWWDYEKFKNGYEKDFKQLYESNSSNSSTNTATYLDDIILKGLAFQKWLKQDDYISAIYDEYTCIWTGDITKNSDGSVSVELTLYDKENYEDTMRYTGQLTNAYYGKETIKLTKEEAMTNNNSNSSNNINSSINTNTNNSEDTRKYTASQSDINHRISFFNSFYGWNFKPTNEQMEEMIEFANNTSNFGNDALENFIKEKGWVND